MKKTIKKWLERLAEANEQSFGSGRLDCCNLNRETTNPKVNKVSKAK